MNDDERAYRAQYPDGGDDDDQIVRLRHLEADQEYEIYRLVFTQFQVLGVVESVARTHNEIYLAVLGELQSAVALMYDSFHPNARITGYIRGYRAIDAYSTALSDGIVRAFAEPYAAMFVNGIKPRDFFQPRLLEGLKARVFDGAFDGDAVRLAIKRFFERHHVMRNEVAHGLKIPTHDEMRAMLLDAKSVHDLADAALNPNATHPLDVLDAQDYPHDDYRPTVVVNPPARPA
jgi:hypothetical protein